MRTTDDRYRQERHRFELALRMIGHEARTGTIRYWTGLSDDRVRKLYAAYFKHTVVRIRRRRGKSPTRIAPLLESPQRALESGVLLNLLSSNELLSTSLAPQLRLNIELGHRFCECFETYLALVTRPTLNLEWTWNLLRSVRRGDELGVRDCPTCGSAYLCDLLALPASPCPVCCLNPGTTRH